MTNDQAEHPHTPYMPTPGLHQCRQQGKEEGHANLKDCMMQVVGCMSAPHGRLLGHIERQQSPLQEHLLLQVCLHECLCHGLP